VSRLGRADGPPDAWADLPPLHSKPRPYQAVEPTPAYTDAGRPVQVLRRVAPAIDSAERAARQAEYLESLGLDGRAFALPPVGQPGNCQGWVFAGGRYWLPSAEVEAVLADNGYTEVASPRRGDVAVHRAGVRLVHTGVVAAVAADVGVSVESTWGEQGHYLHP